MYVYTYTTDDGAAALTLRHHIPGASSHASARQLSRRREVGVGLHQPGTQAGPGAIVLEHAVQRVANQLVAVLEQIGPELATRARQAMQRVEIQLSRELARNAAPQRRQQIPSADALGVPPRSDRAHG